MIGFWHILSDQKACISAKMRGIEVPDMGEMDDMTKILSSRQVKVKLSSWYRQWGDKGLPPPETLEAAEIWEHAEELALDLPDGDTRVGSTAGCRGR